MWSLFSFYVLSDLLSWLFWVLKLLYVFVLSFVFCSVYVFISVALLGYIRNIWSWWCAHSWYEHVKPANWWRWIICKVHKDSFGVISLLFQLTLQPHFCLESTFSALMYLKLTCCLKLRRLFWSGCTEVNWHLETPHPFLKFWSIYDWRVSIFEC